MRCQNCGEQEAVVHLTQIVNNDVTTLHLCEQCAADKGIESGAIPEIPLGGFFATMGKGIGASLPAMADAPHATCPTCGLTMQEFRDLGRLGCMDCYKTFEAPLRELLRRLHGSTLHVGERYHPPGMAAQNHQLEAAELREHLRAAIDAENFELAAELRDRLRGLEC